MPILHILTSTNLILVAPLISFLVITALPHLWSYNLECTNHHHNQTDFLNWLYQPAPSPLLCLFKLISSINSSTTHSQSSFITHYFFNYTVSSCSHYMMNPITASVAIITLFLAPTLALAQPAISDAFTAGRNCSQAELALDRGTALFRQGDVEGSIAEFDKAIEFDPSKRTYLWQRGISLYYLNRFKKGAEQFRLDVTQSPNDTEEAIWCFVCETKLYGAAQARERFLKVGRDRRWVMREAYKMVKDEGNPEKFVNAFRGRPHKYFYASLYAGLYYESQNEENAAKRYIVSAYKTRYGQNSRDYMAAVAKVHCQLRNWID